MTTLTASDHISSALILEYVLKMLLLYVFPVHAHQSQHETMKVVSHKFSNEDIVHICAFEILFHELIN